MDEIPSAMDTRNDKDGMKNKVTSSANEEYSSVIDEDSMAVVSPEPPNPP